MATVGVLTNVLIIIEEDFLLVFIVSIHGDVVSSSEVDNKGVSFLANVGGVEPEEGHEDKLANGAFENSSREFRLLLVDGVESLLAGANDHHREENGKDAHVSQGIVESEFISIKFSWKLDSWLMVPSVFNVTGNDQVGKLSSTKEHTGTGQSAVSTSNEEDPGGDL